MKFLKRLTRILVLVLFFGAIGVGVMHHLSKRTPTGYAPTQLTADERAAAAWRLEHQKMPQLLNMATESQAKASAAVRAQARGASLPAGTTQPLSAVTVSFTQDEINSSLWKWSEPYKSDYERYLTGPYVSLEEGAVVLMGTVPEFGRVASAYFEPKLDEQGMLRCDLTSLKVGSLPLPESLLSKKRAKLEEALKAQLPQWQNRAKIDPTGIANSDANAAALGKLVLQILNHQPSPAVIFLAKDFPNHSRTIPVRLTNVTVEKGALTITVQPMDATERAALLDQIRAPQQSASADVPKS